MAAPPARPGPVWRGRDVSDTEIDLWVTEADAAYDVQAAMAAQGYLHGDPPLTEIIDGVRVPIPERTVGYAEAEFLIYQGLKERLDPNDIVLITGVTMEVVLAPGLTRMIGIVVYTIDDWRDRHRKHTIVDNIAAAIEVRRGIALESQKWPGRHHVQARSDLQDLMRDYRQAGLPALTCTPDPVDLDAAAAILRAVVACRRHALSNYGEATPQTLAQVAADMARGSRPSRLQEALEQALP